MTLRQPRHCCQLRPASRHRRHQRAPLTRRSPAQRSTSLSCKRTRWAARSHANGFPAARVAPLQSAACRCGLWGARLRPAACKLMTNRSCKAQRPQQRAGLRDMQPQPCCAWARAGQQGARCRCALARRATRMCGVVQRLCIKPAAAAAPRAAGGRSWRQCSGPQRWSLRRRAARCALRCAIYGALRA